MQTILYQGRPKEDGHWLVLPERFVSDYQQLDYQVRALVLRADAEQAKVEHFNAALEQAAQLVQEELGVVAAAAAVKKLRALKLEQPEMAGAA